MNSIALQILALGALLGLLNPPKAGELCCVTVVCAVVIPWLLAAYGRKLDADLDRQRKEIQELRRKRGVHER